MDKCVDYLRRVSTYRRHHHHHRTDAHELEGVFRISGSSSEIMRIKALFNTGIVPDFDTVNDPHVVTGLLKLWLRELPDPLIPFDNYDGFISAWKRGRTDVDRAANLLVELKKLPFENFSTMKLLIGYLHHCCQYTSVNRMAPNNMAIVFSPTLMQPRASSLDMITDMSTQSEIVQVLVEEFEHMFAV